MHATTLPYKTLYIDDIYVNNKEEYDLPTNIVDVAAIRAVIDWDKECELKVAPHLPRDALDLGNYHFKKILT